MNILKIQDNLKNLSDEQLAQEMRLPSGSSPQYLVMTEMQRRQKMREEFSGNEPPKTTMAEEMSGDVPPAPPVGGQPPDGGQAEMAPQEANAQGLMGLPDQTMAGGAMRARISGQPQQMDGMTAMPPQGMAAGGAVQFGNPFAGAQMGSAPSSTGYAPIQQYSPKYYAPNKATDYGDIRHQFDGMFATKKGAPNPRVRMSDAERYGIPAGMAAPTYGTTPGLNQTFTGKEGQNAHYSFANDAARDAYIKSMTPVKKADGGPIYAAGGIFTGQPYTPSSDPTQMSDDELLAAATGKDAAQRDPARAELDRRNSQSRIGRMGGDLYRAAGNIGEKIPYVAPYMFPPTLVPTVVGDIVKGTSDYLSAPSAPINVPRLSGRDIPGAVEAVSEYEVPEQLAPPEDVGKGTNAPMVPPNVAPRKRTPLSAPVSGPSDKGIASLPTGPKGMTYEDYMRQANELISGGREDPEALKNRSFNNALMKLGLGMAGSKSQSLLGAVAEGGLPALEGYNEDEAQRRKDDRALVSDKLATLGVGAQMSQAEAKAADERAYREADAEIRRSEVAARREDALLTRAQRETELDLRKLQLDAEIFNARNPESRRVAEEAYGPGGAVIAERIKLLNVLSDNLVAQQKTAKDALLNNPNQSTQDDYDFVTAKLNETNRNFEILASTGRTAQSSTTPTKPPPSEYSIPGTR